MQIMWFTERAYHDIPEEEVIRSRSFFGLPNTHFDPSQARPEAAWGVSVFGVSPPVQQLYSNALSIILCYGIKIVPIYLTDPG